MIVVECFLDTYVIDQFGIPKRYREHAEGKGNVLNYLNKFDEMTLGIIDEDPGRTQPERLNNYYPTEDLFSTHGLKLLTKEGRAARIIVIQDDMEHWIYARATNNDISPQQYGLPNSARELHSLPRVEKTKKFQDFFTDLMDVEDRGIEQLREWVVIELSL